MPQAIEAPPKEAIPDLTKIRIEDGKPVDSIHNEKQQRLLASALQRPWPGLAPGRRWMVFANVGYFYRISPTRGLAPDAMLSLDVEPGDPLQEAADRSYFLWQRGKPPEVVVEIVSDYEGEELGAKRDQYALGMVPYYAVFDPRLRLSDQMLQAFRRESDTGSYVALDRAWFPLVSLGLRVWEGEYEGVRSTWLRWCDQHANVIPTETEFAEAQRQRAETQQQRADRLAARLRELGINPDEV
ncbi:MAG: Uma2 family endonuclease [Gemmataceae bacterium]|nr:Uma2 family endonuclease [Gemmataceae bacterium]